MLKAVTRQATAVDNKIKDLNNNLPPGKPRISTANFFDHYAAPEDIAVMVTEQDFLDANRELIPSVSAGELQHYERVRATFEGGRDKKDAAKNGSTVVVDGHEAIPERLKANGKGKGKAVAKGKGKAVAGDSEEDVDGSDQAYGSYKGKGKAVMRFEQGTGSDDDGLY